ncbi:hypothetical protein Aam_070_031 [Acidocella aminolytica 101 = DSM 11237]|uniref:Uncharacterized protein n=1 Tax=Acidocella aminolytica 101 = DSM 11237 TaxID=1120923 RepID=A0A0D6PJR7_9PROT|nr:hypothetical protein Aam_070_031 [Acidocella aminolytica 101 = DSM 11237]GBQ38482.1 hypothetical protein AA11237_1812 [Acidocella aminolytica 101 = DSM 11237]
MLQPNANNTGNNQAAIGDADNVNLQYRQEIGWKKKKKCGDGANERCVEIAAVHALQREAAAFANEIAVIFYAGDGLNQPAMRTADNFTQLVHGPHGL